MMTTINRSYKIRCYLAHAQEDLSARTEGCCRYVYNRAAREISEAFKNGIKKSVIDMSREVTQWKKDEETQWLADVPGGAITQSLRDLEKGYANFFAGRAEYPTPHKKQFGCSVRLQIDQRLNRTASAWLEQRIILPGFGAIKLAQPERVPVERAKMITLRRDGAGRFFVSFGVAQEAEPLPATGRSVGVDVGVKTLAALSTGEKVAAAKKLKKLHRQLKHQQRILSRRKGARKGEAQSNRYRRQRRKLARIHCRIADTRADGIHKLTDKLTGDFDVIALEDLNVKGMMSSAKGTAEQPGKRAAQKAGLNRGIASASLAELRRQVEYKAGWRGRQVIYADRWAASSKTCSCCGFRLKELKLGTRTWDCPECGAAHDRDVNASVNILAFAAAGGLPVDARGGLNNPTEPTVRKATKGPNEARTKRGHAVTRRDRVAA